MQMFLFHAQLSPVQQQQQLLPPEGAAKIDGKPRIRSGTPGRAGTKGREILLSYMRSWLLGKKTFSSVQMHPNS